MLTRPKGRETVATAGSAVRQVARIPYFVPVRGGGAGCGAGNCDSYTCSTFLGSGSSEFRSYVKVELDVLGSPVLIILLVSVDRK